MTLSSGYLKIHVCWFTPRYLCLNIRKCSRAPYSPRPRRRSHRSLGHSLELETGVFPTSPEEDSASETVHSFHNPPRNGRAGTRSQGWQTASLQVATPTSVICSMTSRTQRSRRSPIQTFTLKLGLIGSPQWIQVR